MRHVTIAIVILLLAVAPDTCEARVIKFVETYEEAVRKAQKTGLMICAIRRSKHSEACQRFEKEVLTDSRVQELSSKFIFVSIDADISAFLVDKELPRLPRTVFLDKDETEIDSLSGFVMPNVLVKRAMNAFGIGGPTADIKTYRSLDKNFTAGKNAFDKGNYLLAIKHLRIASEFEVRDKRPGQARGMLKTIDVRGLEKIEAAKALKTEGKWQEAVAELESIVRDFKGSNAAKTAIDELARLSEDPAFRRVQREAAAHKILNAAKAANDAGQYAKAMSCLRTLIKQFEDTSSYEEAKKLLAELENNKEVMAKLANDEAESKCQSWLLMAKSFRLNKRHEQAIEYYDRVIAAFPESKFADEAREKKAELRRLLDGQ